MIDRYSHPEMEKLFSLNAQYQRWFGVEIAVFNAHVMVGNVPIETMNQLVQKLESMASADSEAFMQIDDPAHDGVYYLERAGYFNDELVQQVLDREKVTHHDVEAFLQVAAGQVGAPLDRWIHYGMTSSDLVDTGFALQVREYAGLVSPLLDNLAMVLQELGGHLEGYLMVGRTHGQYAEEFEGTQLPLGWYNHLNNTANLLALATEAMPGKMSGPLGDYRWPLSLQVEEIVAKILGLSTPLAGIGQAVPRYYYTNYAHALCEVSMWCEQVATQIRLRAIQGADEWAEGKTLGEAGSSAMPHKSSNPIRCEQVCGLSRVARGHFLAIMESQVWWHEHDISHSSVERVAMRGLMEVVYHQLNQMVTVLSNLRLDKATTTRLRKQAQNRGIGSYERMNRLVAEGSTRQEARNAVRS